MLHVAFVAFPDQIFWTSLTWIYINNEVPESFGNELFIVRNWYNFFPITEFNVIGNAVQKHSQQKRLEHWNNPSLFDQLLLDLNQWWRCFRAQSSVIECSGLFSIISSRVDSCFSKFLPGDLQHSTWTMVISVTIECYQHSMPFASWR